MIQRRKKRYISWMGTGQLTCNREGVGLIRPYDPQARANMMGTARPLETTQQPARRTCSPTKSSRRLSRAHNRAESIQRCSYAS